MKKLFAIVISLVLCITCFAVPAFADDLDTPVEPIDIDEYAVRQIIKTGSFPVFDGANNDGVTVHYSIIGYAELDTNGNVTSFILDSFSHYETTGGGTLLNDSVTFSHAHLHDNIADLYIHYNISYTDLNNTSHYENTLYLVRSIQ